MQEGSMTNKNDDRSLTFELQADKDYTYVVAAEGKAHGADWRINEPEHGYLTPAKLLAMTAIDLLHGDAGPAQQILSGFEPAMTKDAYLAFQRALFRKERSAYTEE
jgi:hypothetical protein